MRIARSWTFLAASLFVAGAALRAALYFPPAAFPIDSDGVLAGLCAFRVADGQHPAFFPGGVRLSSASCYLTAGYFHLFGAGRVGLALTGLTWGMLYLAFSLLFLRAVLGRRGACTAFLFAIVPPVAFVTVTYVPWGYGEIVASCAATLWLAAVWRRDGRVWQCVAFGASAGLGLWFSLQTLMVALPALVWVVLERKRTALRECTAAILGALVGASPLLVANAATGFPTFAHNWAARPTAGLENATDNLVWLVSSQLPQLLFYGSWPPGWFSIAIVTGYVLLGIGFVAALRAEGRERAAIGARNAGTLALLVAAAVVLLYAWSQAGNARGWTVRYVVPLYVVLPPVFGIAALALARQNRWLAAAAVALVLFPNLPLYALPATATRAVLTEQLHADAAVGELLTRSKVTLVFGDYFTVYHLNFDARERLAAIPYQRQLDYMHYESTLPASGLRWAVLSYYPLQVQRWASAAQATGPMSHVGDLYVIVETRPATSTTTLLAMLRKAGD